MTTWECKVCGYVHKGDEAPESCPVCKASADKFAKNSDVKAEFSGSKTEKNLMEAFAGESQARNRYTYYADVAKAAGEDKIAALFLQTAENEKEHARIWFKALGELGDSKANLLRAAEGEHAEWTDMYERMARDAEEEGFKDIAKKFRAIGLVEQMHEQRYRSMLKNSDTADISTPENTVICNCMGVTINDIDIALHSTDNLSDVTEAFKTIQAQTQASTGCGGCYNKILQVISDLMNS